MDKERVLLEYLITCPAIKNSPFYFNFIEAQDDNKQFVTSENDKVTNRNFLDGSIEKQYTFTIIDYKSVAYRAIVKSLNMESDENLEEYLDVKALIEWITEQNNLKNFPDFGGDCIIDKIEALTENPNLNGVDTTTTPSLAKYSVAIRITYIDTSKAIWNK